MSRSDYDQAILDALTRIADALEAANALRVSQ